MVESPHIERTALTLTNDSPDHRGMTAVLRFAEGERRGDHVLDSREPTLVGRSSTMTSHGIQVPPNERASARVSAIHASFMLDDQGHWVVEDLGSSNGTYVDGRRLQKHSPTRLGARNEIQFGDAGPTAEFILRTDEAKAHAPIPIGDYAIMLAPVETLFSTEAHLTFRNKPIIRLGRDPNSHVAFKSGVHGSVSANHARIHWTGRGFRLVDLSKQGLWVNGEPVSVTMLEEGQIIEFGPGGPKLAVLSIETSDGARSRSLDELQATIDELARAQQVQQQSTRRGFLFAGVGVAALALGGWGLHRVLRRDPNEIFRRLRERYEPGLLLLYSEFRILASVEGETVEHERGDSFGTAFLVTNDGHAITNRHVVEPWRGQLEYARSLAEARAAYGADKVRIASRLAAWPANSRFARGQQVDFDVGFNMHVLDNLTIVGMPDFDPNVTVIDDVEVETIKPTHESDLALLELRGAAITPDSIVEFLSADERPEPLDDVLSGGFPHGQSVLERDRAVPTFTTGKVKKVERTYQLDIGVTGGSSGGPVFDLEGRVIGVTTRKLDEHVELIPAQVVREFIAGLGITLES
jgi:pSer/pThr/pTyr-binding forkhead associated (FHA) protein